MSLKSSYYLLEVWQADNISLLFFGITTSTNQIY